MATKLFRRFNLFGTSLINYNKSMFKPIYLQSSFLSAGKTNHTYVVALDGTDFAYSALRRAFECSNGADRVIAIYFPASMERLEVELMIFGPNQATPEIKQLKTEVEQLKEKTIQKITDAAMQIKNDYCSTHKSMENLLFEIKIG
eukprot:752227_1